jgi:hypothetical protein
VTLAFGSFAPYSAPMGFFNRFNPFLAFADLRGFLAQRQRHELVFAALAVGVTGGILVEFVLDTRSLKAPYEPPEIIYVKQWPANRSLAQVRAQQKIDAAQAKIDKAKNDAILEKRRAVFKRIDKALDRMGL